MKSKKSACIEMLYCEIPFLERFQAAKEDGFEYVEFWSYTDKNLDQIKSASESAGIGIAGFNGDADYSLIDSEQKGRYLTFLQQSVDAAKYIGAKSVTIHSNALGEGGVVINHYDNLSDTLKLCSMYDTLLECARIAEKSRININLEPLNVTTDHVGNFLIHTGMAAEMTRLIGCKYLKILYDVYHMQLNEGNILNTIDSFGDQFGHIHIADAPGRHEPGTGEICYRKVFEKLAQIGYDGLIGFELLPETTTKKAVKAIMSF